MLPVERVVSIERVNGPAELRQESTLSEVTKSVVGMYVVVPLALVMAPVVLAAHAAGVDLIDEKPPNKDGNVFRHVVQLSADDAEVTQDEYFSYKVGDCVALRSKPVLLVPALPDQCD